MVDSRMHRGQQWLQSLLQLMGIPAEVKAEVEQNQLQDSDLEEVNNYWLTIDRTNLTPTQIQTTIGTEGHVLDAIQYLANAILNLSQAQLPPQQAFYTVELDGYRVRRQAEIQKIAEDAAERARESSQEVEIKSLSSAERRQVHTFMKNFPDLETFSRGKEPNRQLVVRKVEK